MRVDKMLSQMYGNGADHVRTADAGSGGRWTEWRRSLVGRWPALEKVFNARVFDAGGRGRLAIATGLLACLGVAAVGESVAAIDQQPTKPMDSVALQASMVDRAAQLRLADPASRASQRTAPAVIAKAPVKKPPVKKPPVKKAPVKKPPVRPVAGLNQTQMNNAAAVVRATQKMRMPKRAAVIAVATAMQESQLYNLASDAIPESMRYPHQGTGADHDSVGLFQQRSSVGWGPVRALMRPEYAATQFLAALRNVPGWQRMQLTYAAQAVQYSAFPEAYAKHEGRATVVVNALTR